VEFALAADKVNVREWQALTQARSSRSEPQDARTERSPDSLIRRISGSGRLNASTVVYDTLQLTNVNAMVKLDRGVVTMAPLNAGLFGGEEVGTVVLDSRTVPPVFRVDARLQNVDANRLLSAVSPIKDALYGTLSVDAETLFAPTGDAQSIARSLNGRVSLNLNNGAIANMDLLREMGRIARFLRSGKPVEPVTKVIEMSGDFDIDDGLARTDNLKATMDAGSFAASGDVDLVGQKLNLRVTAVLSKEYSETVGGTRIGGLMNTALANENGELVVPLIVSGTFQDPQFAPDLQKVAEMRLRQAAPSADDPTESGAGILQRILRGRRAPEEAPSGEEDAQVPEQQDAPEEDQAPDERQVPDRQIPDLLDRLLKRIP
jgi:AsmA protein